MTKHHSAHYCTSEFIYILFSRNKKLFKHQTSKLLTNKNSRVSCKIFLFLELTVIYFLQYVWTITAHTHRTAVYQLHYNFEATN